MFFERAVNSFPKLVREVDLLDLDSGIRSFADYKGKRKQLVFVTRSPHDAYTLMVYEKRPSGSSFSTGKRLLVKEFQRKEELTKFMRRLLSRPVQAFVY